jgi:hypothetical protein
MWREAMWRVLVPFAFLLVAGCQLAQNGEDYFSRALNQTLLNGAELPYDFKQRIALRFYEAHDAPFSITAGKISTKKGSYELNDNNKFCVSLEVAEINSSEVYIVTVDKRGQVHITRAGVVDCLDVAWKPFPEVVIDY